MIWRNSTCNRGYFGERKGGKYRPSNIFSTEEQFSFDYGFPSRTNKKMGVGVREGGQCVLRTGSNQSSTAS